jgi:hypothetical protein
VLNVALVAGVVCGVVVVAVGLGVWCLRGSSKVLVEGRGTRAQYEFNFLQNLNIDLDTRGYVPVDRVQKH